MKFGTKNIVAAGDLHGDLETVMSLKSELENSVIFQVGDFCAHGDGLALPRSTARLDNLLALLNSTMIVLRGNWDHPTLFTGEHDLQNIRFIPDGTQVEVAGVRCLCVGGAISIDRTSRRWCKWPETAVKPPAMSVTTTDFLFTHSFPRRRLPLRFQKTTKGLASNYQDETLLHDLGKEDEALEQWATASRPERGWVFGHFHKYLPLAKSPIPALGVGFRQVIRIHTA
jgi:hypothetical protein